MRLRCSETIWISNDASAAERQRSCKLLITVLPKHYADAVFVPAKQGIQASLFPGLNFDKLASVTKTISRPGEWPQVSNVESIQRASCVFLRQDTYDPNGEVRVQSFQDPNICYHTYHRPGHGERIHAVLFLQCLPSSEWLSAIGGIYRVNPKFFQRHLDFWRLRGDWWLLDTSIIFGVFIMKFDFAYIIIDFTSIPYQHFAKCPKLVMSPPKKVRRIETSAIINR